MKMFRVTTTTSFGWSSTMFALFLAVWSAEVPAFVTAQQQTCLQVDTVSNLDLDAFISKPWYVQQQAENSYTSRDFNQCVTAQYVRKGYKTFWGYDIGVYNVARNANGRTMVGELCASVTGSGTLQVAPCFLPKATAGPYWIVAYKEGDDGYALISGGQPKNLVTTGNDVNTCGPDGNRPCCKTGNGVNNSGLWIFTRQKNPSRELVNRVRAVAKRKGFATSVLFDVTHPSDCDIYPNIVRNSGSGGGNGGNGRGRGLLRANH